VIAVVIFGTRKLRNVGSDVGGAVKDFKKALKDESAPNTTAQSTVTSNVDENVVSEQKENV